MTKPNAIFAIFLVAASVFSTTLKANESEDIKAKTVRGKIQHLMDDSNLSTTLESVPALIEFELGYLRQQDGLLSPSQEATLKKELLARFHPEEIRHHMLASPLLNTLSADELLAFHQLLQTPEIREIHALLSPDINNTREELLTYHDKLEESEAQTHRLTLVTAVDMLSHQSKWQAYLHYVIKQAILEQTGHKAPQTDIKPYQNLDIEQEIARTAQYRQTILLYAFRQTPSLDIMHYLDTLSMESNRHLLNALDQAYTEALMHRLHLNIQLQ